MKKQIFDFYATPLNIWYLLGIAFVAMAASGITYNYLHRNMVWIQRCDSHLFQDLFMA